MFLVEASDWFSNHLVKVHVLVPWLWTSDLGEQFLQRQEVSCHKSVEFSLRLVVARTVHLSKNLITLEPQRGVVSFQAELNLVLETTVIWRTRFLIKASDHGRWALHMG